MNFNALKRHIRTGFQNIVRNKWMTVASVGAVTTTLLLVAVFLVLIFNVNQMATNLEEDVQINTIIERPSTQEEIVALGEDIEQMDGVAAISFSSNDEELQNLIGSFGDEGGSWQMYQQENPLHHVFMVRAENPEDTERIASEIEGLNNVQDVIYGQEVVEQLLTFNNYVRAVGIILAVALILTAAFLISNTIKITIVARSREIGIMKLVGATNGFIRGPFIVEGLLLGILGSVIPIAVTLSGYYYLSTSFNSGLSINFIELLPFSPFAWLLSLFILIIGAGIGVFGSVMSIRKFLKV